eukprot:53860-Rhodomonas_salina.2
MRLVLCCAPACAEPEVAVATVVCRERSGGGWEMGGLLLLLTVREKRWRRRVRRRRRRSRDGGTGRVGSHLASSLSGCRGLFGSFSGTFSRKRSPLHVTKSGARYTRELGAAYPSRSVTSGAADWDGAERGVESRQWARVGPEEASE